MLFTVAITTAPPLALHFWPAHRAFKIKSNDMDSPKKFASADEVTIFINFTLSFYFVVVSPFWQQTKELTFN